MSIPNYELPQDIPTSDYLKDGEPLAKLSEEELEAILAKFSVDELVENSTKGKPEHAKVSTKKRTVRNRIIAFAIACMLAFGTIQEIHNMADRIEQNTIIYEQRKDFQKKVIEPNTHRTDGNQYYFYDYDDIAAAITEDGNDFSTGLYLTYASLGENQTNQVLAHTNHESVEAYAIANGFESVEDWAKSEREKIVLQAELSAMYDEMNAQNTDNPVVIDNVGGK